MRDYPKQKAPQNTSSLKNEIVFKAYNPHNSSSRKEDRQKKAAQAVQSQLAVKETNNVSQNLGFGKKLDAAEEQSNCHSEMAVAYLRHYQSKNHKMDIIPPLRKNAIPIVPKVNNETFTSPGIQEFNKVHNCSCSDELATVLCAVAFCSKYGQLSKRDENAKRDELAKNDELTRMDGFTKLDEFVYGYVTYLWIHLNICTSAPGHLLPRYPRFYNAYRGKFIKDLSTEIITMDVLLELRSSFSESWDSVFQNRKESVDLNEIVSEINDAPGSTGINHSSPVRLSSPFTSISPSSETAECALKEMEVVEN